MIKYEKILDINVCTLDYNELKKAVKKNIENSKKSFIVAINPEKVIKSRVDSDLKNILNNAKYPIPDGIGIVVASKLRNGKIKKRITGIDSMEMLCELANENKYKVFLYGTKEEVLLTAVNNLKNKYPNMEIVGYINGYVKDEKKIIKQINKAKPNILFVALGSPKQELFIKNNIDNINCNIFQGVGGSFDVISGNIKRAPIFIQKLGLEWFYRLLKEPKRIIRQLSLFKFLWLAIFYRKKDK